MERRGELGFGTIVRSNDDVQVPFATCQPERPRGPVVRPYWTRALLCTRRLSLHPCMGPVSTPPKQKKKSRNGSKPRTPLRFSRARRLAEKQQIEALEQAALQFVRSAFFFKHFFFIIDKARLPQMTQEPFLIFQYQILRRKVWTVHIRIAAVLKPRTRLEEGFLRRDDRRAGEKSTSLLKRDGHSRCRAYG